LLRAMAPPRPIYPGGSRSMDCGGSKDEQVIFEEKYPYIAA
jgi:hypothetical protein